MLYEFSHPTKPVGKFHYNAAFSVYSAMPIVTAKDLSLSFGSHPILQGVNLSIERGERICLVGRNGCGKSTLLGIIAGRIEADEGVRVVDPAVRIA